MRKFHGEGTALLIVALAFYRGLPAGSKLGAAPWWVWVGGLFGAFNVLGTVVTAPKLGAATLVALILAGPAVSSLLVDQFGWVGSPRADQPRAGERPAAPRRGRRARPRDVKRALVAVLLDWFQNDHPPTGCDPWM